jgi:regulator of protease activity HflC (stomatin/prohibitin superfamily)
VVTTVPGGHRVVVYDRYAGVDMEVKNEGLHFLIPWLQRPNMFDIRTRPFELTSLTGSRGALSEYPCTQTQIVPHRECCCIVFDSSCHR